MLDKILPYLNDVVLSWDVDKGCYLFISPNAYQLTGYNESDIKSADWISYIHANDAEEVQLAISQLQLHTCVELNYRIITFRGDVKWVKDRKAMFTDDDGTCVLLSVIKDTSDRRSVNFKLKETFGDFSLLFNRNPNPMWVYEMPSLRFLKVNEAAISHYGFTEDEFLAMTIREIRPPDELAAFNKYVYKPGLQGSPFTGLNQGGVWRHKKKNGEIIYVEITGHEVKYGGSICRIISATDVTERIHYQEEVKRREKFLTSLIDSQTTYLTRVDVNGNFTFVNRRFLQGAKYTHNKIAGHHFTEVIIPDEEEVCRRVFYACLKTPGKVVYLLHQLKTSDGNLRWTEWEFVGISDEHGRVTEVQGVGQDVHERVVNEKIAKKAQEEAARIKTNLEALINNTEDMIWAIDKDERLVVLNNAFKRRIQSLTGSEPQEGDNIHTKPLQQFRAEWDDYYKRVLSGERYLVKRKSVSPVTNQVLYHEISFNPIFDAGGEVIGAGCFSRDVTERIVAENEIIKRNEHLATIASLSSHELRRPVASLIGLLNLLNRNDLADPENRPIVDYLFVAANEVDEVIRTIVSKTFVAGEDKGL